jgi:mannosyltransferase OCH1-like enzyme
MLRDEYINNTNNTFPIPKIVHTSFKTYESIPKEYNQVFKSWKVTNPDWEVKFYSYKDNDILVKNNFPWLYDTYKNFYFDEQRLDMAKACYLYLYGGLYVDVNYLPLANIDPLFYKSNDELYFAYNNDNTQNTIVSSFIASKPKSSFWLSYLKNIIGDNGNIFSTKYGIINSTTGSQKITDLMKKYNGTIGKLPYNEINSCTECNENCNQSFYFHVINNGSNINGQFFTDVDVVFFKFIYCFFKKNWFLILFAIVIAIIVFFIYLWITYKTFLMLPPFLFFIYKKTMKNVDDVIDNVKKDIGDNVDNLFHLIKKSTPKQYKKKEKKE